MKNKWSSYKTVKDFEISIVGKGRYDNWSSLFAEEAIVHPKIEIVKDSVAKIMEYKQKDTQRQSYTSKYIIYLPDYDVSYRCTAEWHIASCFVEVPINSTEIWSVLHEKLT